MHSRLLRVNKLCFEKHLLDILYFVDCKLIDAVTII